MFRIRYEFRAQERTFWVWIKSDDLGYFARIADADGGGGLLLNHPPRLQIDPGSFYNDRKYYRDELIKLVNAELRRWSVQPQKTEDRRSETDAYVKASLSGWPRGYPGVTIDELTDETGRFTSL